MVTPTHQPHARVAFLVTIQGGDLRAATSVQPVSMTLTLIRRLRARTAQQASTPQRGQYHAVTVWEDMQTRTVIHRLHACLARQGRTLHQTRHFVCAVQRGSTLQQSQQLAMIVRLATQTTTMIRRLCVRGAI